jgi:hypothetical protein
VLNTTKKNNMIALKINISIIVKFKKDELSKNKKSG